MKKIIFALGLLLASCTSANKPVEMPVEECCDSTVVVADTVVTVDTVPSDTIVLE